jgi:hypothetical protein
MAHEGFYITLAVQKFKQVAENIALSAASFAAVPHHRALVG